MLKHLVLVTILTLIFIITGCENTENDVTLIKQLLEDSQYTAEGTIAFDDSSSTPTDEKLTDSIIPWVRFVRRIERPITRNIEVQVTGDSAVATITALLNGNPPDYGFFVRNQIDSALLYKRAITDSAQRRVKLYKDNNGWHILSMTIWDTRTANALNPVSIDEIKAEVLSRNYVFRLTDPAKFLTRDSLPVFLPNDTVKITVLTSAANDSSWAFIHRGRRFNYYWHIRQPLFKQNTTTFTRTYVISDENPVPPCVRHSAIDVISWQTLFGDSTATYSARAWGFPYIIKNTSDEIPE